MRKKVIIATSVVLLLLTGCGQPAPDLGDSPNNPGGVIDDNNVSGETIDVNEDPQSGGTDGTGNGDGTGNDVGTGIDTETTNDITESNYTGDNSSGNNFRSIYFGFDRFQIASDMQSNVNHNGKVANAVSSTLKIEGNCDEFGTDEYNYALGLKRAKTIKDRMTSQGIDSRRMVMVSFGESNPVCTEATDDCYDKNRRVDIRLAQ